MSKFKAAAAVIITMFALVIAGDMVAHVDAMIADTNSAIEIVAMMK